MNKKAIGAFGEEQSRRWLEGLGYELVCQNFQSPFGEIDLIMKQGRTLVFIEVKTRTSLIYGMPAESITKEKQKHMKKTALYFLNRYPQDWDGMRFDVMEWYLGHRKGVVF